MIVPPPPAIVAQATRFPPIPADLQTIIAKRAGKVPDSVIVIGRRIGDDVRIDVMAAPSMGKVDGNVRFEVDGITEAVTATLLAESVRRGEVRLDQPIDARHGVTFADLATHRAGFPALPLRESNQPYAKLDRAAMFALVNGAGLTRDPSAAFAPSPLDFAVLGTLLAERNGVSYAELTRQRVLVPLGMNDSIADTGRDDALVAGHAISGQRVAPWQYAALAPAGALRSTPIDLLRFAGALFDGDNGPLAQDARLAATPRADARNGGGIGLGWLIDRAGGAVYASGGSYGTTSFLGVDQHRRTAVVLLANVGLGFAGTNLDDVGLRVLALTGTQAAVDRPSHVEPLRAATSALQR